MPDWVPTSTWWARISLLIVWLGFTWLSPNFHLMSPHPTILYLFSATRPHGSFALWGCHSALLLSFTALRPATRAEEHHPDPENKYTTGDFFIIGFVVCVYVIGISVLSGQRRPPISFLLILLLLVLSFSNIIYMRIIFTFFAVFLSNSDSSYSHFTVHLPLIMFFSGSHFWFRLYCCSRCFGLFSPRVLFALYWIFPISREWSTLIPSGRET